MIFGQLLSLASEPSPTGDSAIGFKIAVYVTVIILMIVLSAFFSGTEISFNASNKIRLKKRADEGNRTAMLAYKIHERFTEALSAILIGNNLANIAASTAATLIFTNLLAGISIDEGVKSTLITVLSTALITILILILGEITPKIIAKQHADFLVYKVAYPVRIVWIILLPIVKLVMLLVNLLRKIWGKDKSDDEPTVSEEELVSIIETVEEEGVINEDKSELLHSTLEFPETSVEEVMTPRTMLTALDINDSFRKNVAIISSSRYSRLPVYDDSADNIIGILSLNRFYREAVDHEGEFDLRAVLLKPVYLHKTMKLPAALKLMREKHTHIAIVTDEFGGTMGIVSLEDILEELVGDIWDESDIIVEEISESADGVYTVNGDMNIYDFFDAVDVSPKDFESDCTTVGGWATEMLNAEPKTGDSFNYCELTVTVSAMNALRVTQLTAVVNRETPDEEEEK